MNFLGDVFRLVIVCSTGLKSKLKSPGENIFIKMKEKLDVALKSNDVWSYRQICLCMYDVTTNWS